MRIAKFTKALPSHMTRRQKNRRTQRNEPHRGRSPSVDLSTGSESGSEGDVDEDRLSAGGSSDVEGYLPSTLGGTDAASSDEEMNSPEDGDDDGEQNRHNGETDAEELHEGEADDEDEEEAWEDDIEGGLSSDEELFEDDEPDDPSAGRGRSAADTTAARARARRDRAEQQAEWTTLGLPSRLGWSQCVANGLREMAEMELELRRGQANEALHQIRLQLAYKALLLRKTIRNVKSQKKTTRAWRVIRRMEGKVAGQVAIYRHARKAILELLADEGESLRTDKTRDEVDKAYQDILPAHLKMPGDITEEARIGQKNDRLAWFWRFDVGNDMEEDTWLEECECSSVMDEFS